jgi:phosphoglycerate dehydrogenase-like enzyme
MRPVALGRDSRPGRAAQIGVDRLFTREDLPEMLRLADALVICAPHTPETENILDRAAFDALKRGVILVNIGRGQLVDEEEMLEKLRDGTIRLGGLDVFRTEPLPADSPFWDLPNVIANPHSASTSIHENGRIVEIFTHNLACFLDGRFDKMATCWISNGCTRESRSFDVYCYFAPACVSTRFAGDPSTGSG